MPDFFELSDSEFDELVGGADRPVLLAVVAPWCGPCRRLAPFLEQVAEEFVENVTFMKLNTDENPEVPRRLGVESIPTLILFRDGKEIGRMVGAAAKHELRQRLTEAIA